MPFEKRPIGPGSESRPALSGQSYQTDNEESTQWTDQRDSFFTVYLSAIPFLFLEYLAEAFFEVIPSGVVFPFGFLLFWAFYYTYYKPGLLEDRLSNTEDWNFAAIPTVLLGVVVWFVKVTLVGAIRFLLTQIGIEPVQKKRYQVRAVPVVIREAEPSYGPTPLPADIQEALIVLGVANCRHWNKIHARYRELAKKYHPDLNPNDTGLGSRFMRYDLAYKRLYSVRKIYFF